MLSTARVDSRKIRPFDVSHNVLSIYSVSVFRANRSADVSLRYFEHDPQKLKILNIF